MKNRGGNRMARESYVNGNIRLNKQPSSEDEMKTEGDYVHFVETLAQRRAAQILATEDIPAKEIYVNVQALSGLSSRALEKSATASSCFPSAAQACPR